MIGEAVPDFIWMATADGVPVYQNRAWREYTGLTPEEFASLGWEALAHPDDIARLREAWLHAMHESRTFEAEHRCRRKDGAFRWFLCRAAPVHDAQGVTTHWVGTLTDIHAQKVAEAELAHAIRRRDEFLAALAHEVRNPLQAMRQAMEVIALPDATPDVTARMLEIMQSQLHQLTRFTDELADGSRVRWNAMSLTLEETTLSRLIDAAVASSRSAIDERGHTVELCVTDGDRHMTVDAVRVTQALVNLLTNAAKFTDAPGRIRVQARCERGDAEFVVRDWGRGIDAETMPRIFELFERGEFPHQAGREGFGIGLALVRHVAELHGGRVEAESEGVGRGSTFTLRIPLVAAPRA